MLNKNLKLKIFFLLLFISRAIFSHARHDTHKILSRKELQSRGMIQHDNFVLNAIPKCGTHLIMNCIYLMINKHVDEGYDDVTEAQYTKERAAQYLAFLRNLKDLSYIHKTHVPYFPAVEETLLQADMKSLFFIRDPRDAIVSLVFYMEKMSGDKRDFMVIKSDRYDRLSLNEKINAVMTGSCCTNYLDKYFRALMGWTQSPCCQVARFEDLIGPRGGGTLEQQLDAIGQISSYLSVNLSDEEKIAIAQYTNSFTTPQIQNSLNSKYIQGQIGNWASFFNESNKNLFKKLFGKELIELGYEKDNDW